MIGGCLAAATWCSVSEVSRMVVNFQVRTSFWSDVSSLRNDNISQSMSLETCYRHRDIRCLKTSQCRYHVKKTMSLCGYRLPPDSLIGRKCICGVAGVMPVRRFVISRDTSWHDLSQRLSLTCLWYKCTCISKRDSTRKASWWKRLDITLSSRLWQIIMSLFGRKS